LTFVLLPNLVWAHNPAVGIIAVSVLILIFSLIASLIITLKFIKKKIDIKHSLKRNALLILIEIFLFIAIFSLSALILRDWLYI
jgi:hypothetical protein